MKHLNNTDISVNNTENKPKTVKRDSPQQSQRRGHIKNGREGTDMVKNKTDPETVCKSEGNHKHREGRRADPIPRSPGMGGLHWKEGAP